MSEQKDLSEVINNNLCIACGACVSVEEDLKLIMNLQKMMYEPSSYGSEVAAMVCPSIRVDFDWLKKKIFRDAPLTPIGVVESIMLAQSTNFERNYNASSGGIVKELLLEYLSYDGIDGAIVLAHTNNLIFEPIIIKQLEQVDMLPGSIYHNVPFDKALRLLHENKGRYILVATPCQLEGIFNYIFKNCAELYERIYATIGIICGWTYTHHSIKAISEFKGVDFNQIQDISYRGQGKIGSLLIRSQGVNTEVNRRKDFDHAVAFDRSFNIRRCHLCINHINFLSDIVVGDAWLKSTAHTKSGVSIVICRTKEASYIIQILKDKQKIKCVEVTESEIIESQSHSLVFGDFAYAYAEYLKGINQFCPDITGPNRPYATLSLNSDVEKFHQEMMLKIHLQQMGRYRYLWWRKLIFETKRDIYNYIKKILSKRIKMLLGIHLKSSSSQRHDFT